MSSYPARRRGPVWAGVAIVITVLALALRTSPALAGTYATLSGSGSSWASVALVQWANDLAPNGLTVNFLADGSASGRGDYMQGSQVDFAASDPPFRNGKDELGGTGAEHPSYGYSYVPDVGGGTAFMYHVTVGGHLVTNLRLSGETLMKIFTGQITNWDNPEITKDYGAQLPNEPIIPVIRSDGSGATFFLTRWMSHVFPNDWNAFCQRVHPGIQLPCQQTEFYPQFGNAKAENGSNAVSVYVTSSYGEGAIGYDEYAYALNAHWPVVAMANPGGYYVLPTASNVAVALTQAQIDENQNSSDFLQQDLDSVYTYTDPRSYPLSSYSYLIVPQRAQQPADLQPRRRTVAQHVHQLLPLPRAAAGGRARLLAAAVQPGLRRFPASQQDSGNRRGAEHQQLRRLQQPDVHPGRPGHPAERRSVPGQVPEDRLGA